VTIDVCPDVCRACGYLTLGPDLCYFCRPVVAETLPRFSSSLAGPTGTTFAAAGCRGRRSLLGRMPGRAGPHARRRDYRLRALAG
jgi:hypothetical protein